MAGLQRGYPLRVSGYLTGAFYKTSSNGGLTSAYGISNEIGLSPAFGFDGDGPWNILSLFSEGEEGSFSDITTYTTNYFNDAGTTFADIGDPIYHINDQSGNGTDWSQATEADRPILKQDSAGLYLDFSGGKSLSCTLAAGTYTLVIAGREGLWFDSVVSAGGEFTVGAGSYTGGPVNLIPSLGDKLVGPPLLLSRTLSAAERAAYVQWLQDRGASAFEIFALLIEDGSGHLLTEDDNVIYTEAA